MTIIVQQKNQRQKVLIAVSLIMFLVTAFIIWQGFFKEEKIATEPISIIIEREEVKIDFDALKHPLLKTFQPFFEIQPFSQGTSSAETIGRENPFLPL